ncbi:MAG: LytTR family DNA-binding domain-containing protein [Gammaproteobacteria bacterium]
MKVVIVDDEAPARDRLSRLVSELDDYAVVGDATNGAEALMVCHDQAPDIVLMDIRMPGMDGIEAAQNLALLDEPPAVIFTTAYNEYAIEAFEAQAIGYLMKPIRRSRLVAVLAQATRLTRPQLTAVAQREQPLRKRSHLCARVRDDLVLIPVEDVVFLVADQKYVRMRHTAGEVLIDESLKALENEFSDEFLRIHRNALVSVGHMKTLHRQEDGGYEVEVDGCDEHLTVSRRHVSDVKRRIR